MYPFWNTNKKGFTSGAFVPLGTPVSNHHSHTKRERTGWVPAQEQLDSNKKRKGKNNTRWLLFHSEADPTLQAREITRSFSRCKARAHSEGRKAARKKSKQESSPSEGKWELRSLGEGWQGAKAGASAPGKPITLATAGRDGAIRMGSAGRGMAYR